MGATLNESLKEYLKIEIRLYQVYVVFLKKLSQSKGASRCMIIKLVNVHVRAQYLYEGDWKGDE